MHNQIFKKRRRSTRIYVGNVPIGNGAPIAVQSMTKTQTENIEETIKQIQILEKEGVDIIRISIPTLKAAKNIKIFKKKINIPIIADIHFDYRIALEAAKCGADCLRINPGNIGNQKRIAQVIDAAKYNNIPIRIGVNAGSLEKDIKNKYSNFSAIAIVESAMRHVDILEKLNFDQFKVSVKSSDVHTMIQAYQLIAKKIDQPLHLGVTESGRGMVGIIKSAIGIGCLLYEGIGDTLRVSISSDPVEEVKIGLNILKVLRIRERGINFISCPTCSRKEIDVISIVNTLENRLKDITTPMDVSIIGCIVNGLGEASQSTIGITGNRNKSSLYEDGVRQKELLNNNEIIEILEKKIRLKAKKIEEKKI
ncbi:MAG: flavodoxin-dependent (E)-4-hydroxy-3-methylbut-2-enyl-diphosphate synthase [Arsenophonus sp.]|nr:MAG: flavodoxin-dependent (E)-4-hydroxy-3-methylbut-2-enyl-diphosphate synthase [Arsenophonus sp.]